MIGSNSDKQLTCPVFGRHMTFPHTLETAGIISSFSYIVVFLAIPYTRSNGAHGQMSM